MKLKPIELRASMLKAFGTPPVQTGINTGVSISPDEVRRVPTLAFEFESLYLTTKDI